MCPVHINQEVGLEIAQVRPDSSEWFVWLRSDMAHSKCRFCFLRHVDRQEQLTRLIESITDRPVVTEDFDRERFAESLAEEMKDCDRRYLEYCRNERFGRVPGGL